MIGLFNFLVNKAVDTELRQAVVEYAKGQAYYGDGYKLGREMEKPRSREFLYGWLDALQEDIQRLKNHSHGGPTS